MSAWWLLPVALAACLAVVAIAACLSPKPRHAAPRRHLAAVPDTVVTAHPGRVGSMILAEEDDWRARQIAMIHRARDEAEGPDWREQTAADLSPEALDSDVQPDPYLDAIAAEYGSEWDPDGIYCAEHETWVCDVAPEAHQDSGPGAPSSGSDTPGPAQMSESGWTAPPVAKPWPEDTGASEGRVAAATAEASPPPAGWLDGQLAVLYEWVRGMYEAAAA